MWDLNCGGPATSQVKGVPWAVHASTHAAFIKQRRAHSDAWHQSGPIKASLWIDWAMGGLVCWVTAGLICHSLNQEPSILAETIATNTGASITAPPSASRPPPTGCTTGMAPPPTTPWTSPSLWPKAAPPRGWAAVRGLGLPVQRSANRYDCFEASSWFELLFFIFFTAV